MENEIRPDDPRNAPEFDGWLKANAVLGSILAIGILAMALAGLYSVGRLRRDDRIVQCQYPVQLFQRDGGTEALIQPTGFTEMVELVGAGPRTDTWPNIPIVRKLSICVNVAAFSRSSAASFMVEVRLPFDGITDAARPTRFSRGPRAESGCPSGRSPTPGISATRPAAGCRPGWCQSERLRREPPALRPPP